MIAAVTGTVRHAGLDRVVVDVGGVGVLVHTTPSAAADARVGHPVDLATTLVVREDSLTLFGFVTVAERDTFETVQSVSGVGPRIALAMLSVLPPDELSAAVGSGDVTTLMRVPGIGKKSAERLVLELGDKLTGPTAAATSPRAMAPDRGSEVAEALVGLGWSAKQAADAVDAVTPELAADADVAAVLRAALRRLGGARSGR